MAPVRAAAAGSPGSRASPSITGLDTLGIPVFAAIRPMGRSLSTQQGKGLTPEAARISALMESLETFTAEQASGARVRGSYRALARSRRVVDVRELPRPRGRLDLDAAWRWIEGWELAAGEPVLVPHRGRDARHDGCRARRRGAFDISSQRARVRQRARRGDPARPARGDRARRRGRVAARRRRSPDRARLDRRSGVPRADRADLASRRARVRVGPRRARLRVRDRLRDRRGSARAGVAPARLLPGLRRAPRAGGRDRARAHRGGADPADVHRGRRATTSSRSTTRARPIPSCSPGCGRASRAPCDEPVDCSTTCRAIAASGLGEDARAARSRASPRRDRGRLTPPRSACRSSKVLVPGPRDRRGGARMSDAIVFVGPTLPAAEVARAAARRDRAAARPAVGDVLRASRARVCADRAHRRLLRAHGRGLAQGDPASRSSAASRCGARRAWARCARPSSRRSG